MSLAAAASGGGSTRAVRLLHLVVGHAEGRDRDGVGDGDPDLPAFFMSFGACRHAPTSPERPRRAKRGKRGGKKEGRGTIPGAAAKSGSFHLAAPNGFQESHPARCLAEIAAVYGVQGFAVLEAGRQPTWSLLPGQPGRLVLLDAWGWASLMKVLFEGTKTSFHMDAPVFFPIGAAPTSISAVGVGRWSDLIPLSGNRACHSVGVVASVVAHQLIGALGAFPGGAGWLCVVPA